MESMVPIRRLTFRVENIPPGTTAEELKKYFYTEDQPRIQVKSIVPAVDSYELDIREYTATITFQALNQSVLSPRLLDEDISIDRDFHGFTPLYHPQEAIAADIIAVTGLAAHAFGSWAHSTQSMWLRDYLPRDASNARVLIYGYHSQLHGNTSRSILSDHSTNMIHRLLTMRESAKCQDRPIIFIGHSLGCLIIKKALCDVNGSVGIYSSRLPVRSVIFLGAPHKGLETTALETLVKSQATEDMIRELKSGSPTLTELNNKFRYVIEDIDILTCYELSPTKTAIEVIFDYDKQGLFTNSVQMPDGTWKREGPPMMMVSQDSAQLWYPREEFVACNADHSQMAKLKRGENSIYPRVRWAIKKALLSAGDLYTEVKGVHQDESRHLESQDEPSTMRRSLLQVPHRQISMPSNDHPADPAPVPSRSLSDDAIDQQIKKLRQMKIDQSTSGGDTQINHNPLNETVSQWQSGINRGERDDTRSFSNAADSAKPAMTSILRENSGAASMSTNQTTSLGAETTASEEREENANPDPWKIERKVDRITALPAEDSEIATGGAKSMIFDDVIWSAVIAGDEAKTRELLAHSIDVNCCDDSGTTPLHEAARYRHENIVRLLLEQGANRGVQCNDGQTTLHKLAFSPEIPISETLIDLLLEDRPPLDVPTYKERITPLMCACDAGEQLLVTILLRQGANVRAVSAKGWTPLHTAAFAGKAQIIPLLVAHGARLEPKELESGYTPLHVAASYPHDRSDCVEQLLLAGADKEAISKSGLFTPLLLAVLLKNKACAVSILKSGANIEAKDRDGCRSLHLAAARGQLEIIKTLLDHGANPTAKTAKFMGTKPSNVEMEPGVSSTQREAIRALLKEAEKTWKQSGKK